jgi:hypothetical protein
MVVIDRGDYYQNAHLIRKGSDVTLRAEGIEAFRHRVAAMIPWLGDRMGAVRDWRDMALLDVRLDRLRRWSLEGLLCLGDARHPRAATGPGTRRRRHAGRGRVWSTRAGGPAVAAVSPATGHTSDCGGVGLLPEHAPTFARRSAAQAR